MRWELKSLGKSPNPKRGSKPAGETRKKEKTNFRLEQKKQKVRMNNESDYTPSW